MSDSANNTISIQDVLQDDSIDINNESTTITLTNCSGSSDVITITSGYDYSNSYITGPTISTLDLTSITGITLSSDEFKSWTFIETDPFENGFPDSWDDFQEMCKEYPALQNAFEHMKVFYKLCKDEWEAKKRGEDV
jgi:hypothetical protein